MKSVLTLFTAVLILIFSVDIASAQVDPDFDAEAANEDYVFTMDVYNRELAEYRLAKAQYSQAGTLVSQAKAIEETKDLLEARDDVIITYLTAVRMRLVEAEGVSEITKNGLFARIDAEIAWFKDHKSRISSAGTLEDLEDDSEEARERFSTLGQHIVYETLATIPFGRLALMREKANTTINSINDKINQIRSDGGKDTAIAERWSLEVRNKITRSLDKEIEAQAQIPRLAPDDRRRNQNLNNIYNDILFKLDESRQFLRDATENMSEIVREIITQ